MACTKPWHPAYDPQKTKGNRNKKNLEFKTTDQRELNHIILWEIKTTYEKFKPQIRILNRQINFMKVGYTANLYDAYYIRKWF